MKEAIEILKANIEHLSAEDALRYIAAEFGSDATFSSSLGYEDQVITHLIFSNNLPIDTFTLDTGRLFKETYTVLQDTREKYKRNIRVMYPKAEPLENMVTNKGPYSFYESIDNRKECCFIRKVEPLQSALYGKKIWITGIRAEQSANREDMPMLEWDEGNQIIKFHPLLHWSFEQVVAFVKLNNIPYNSLHDTGFVSIGCSPCTRAIRPGEDFRAGRWWWEQTDKKECGLHIITEK